MITLVLGGARSGKSDVGERLAAAMPQPVTYVATGTSTDDEMAARIAAHKLRRPPSWSTLEVSGDELLDALGRVQGSVLVDSLGTWVASCDGLAADGPGLARVLLDRDGDAVVVSDEVGLGVHPSSELGRRFRDALGEVNRAVAEAADDVLLIVAGRALRLDRV